MLIRRATREDLLAFAVIEQAAYARWGFRMLPEDMLTAGLREIRRQEAARGLDRWPRICM